LHYVSFPFSIASVLPIKQAQQQSYQKVLKGLFLVFSRSVELVFGFKVD